MVQFLRNTSLAAMFRFRARSFTTIACRAVEMAAQIKTPNMYGVSVSRTQGVVKGLTGGKCLPLYS